FTEVVRENPMTPPMLCMLMRKHIQGGKILAVTQQGFDRVIRMDVESYNELGDLCIKSVVVEIMGRHSNIILIGDDNKIMDSAKHVDFTVSAVRQILPGLFYSNPPAQDKLNPSDYKPIDILRKLDIDTEDVLLDKFLLDNFIGMSPLIAREIVYRFANNTKVFKSEVETARFVAHVDEFLKGICKNIYAPMLIINPVDKKPLAFSCVKLTQYENSASSIEIESISRVIDTFYVTRAGQERMNQRMANLVKLVHNNIDRCQKKLALHRNNLEKCKNRETYKIYGDLLTANMYKIEYGMKSIEVENYYSESLEKIKINLIENKGPSQNAQRYYKLYNKAKTTEKYALEQSKIAEEEKYYLETVLESLLKSESVSELSEIRDELADGGYVQKDKNKNKKHMKKAVPLSFVSSDGYEILVGKNNKQNDELTIRMAYSTDIWFHTKLIPGSHTIIRTRGESSVPDNTIMEAAELAAYYSKAQNSVQVPVDYTVIKNVKKPNGAKPGMVIYDHYNTLYVTPHKIENKSE
ncbi:MAG: NFACT RNA binding domain-containing protein, partial [Oscillospiraceae bacterium]